MNTKTNPLLSTYTSKASSKYADSSLTKSSLIQCARPTESSTSKLTTETKSYLKAEKKKDDLTSSIKAPNTKLQQPALNLLTKSSLTNKGLLGTTNFTSSTKLSLGGKLTSGLTSGLSLTSSLSGTLGLRSKALKPTTSSLSTTSNRLEGRLVTTTTTTSLALVKKQKKKEKSQPRRKQEDAVVKEHYTDFIIPQYNFDQVCI